MDVRGLGGLLATRPPSIRVGDTVSLFKNPGGSYLDSGPSFSVSATGARESGHAEPADDAVRRALLEPLPGGLAARLGALGRRSRPEEVRAIVLDLLRQRAWWLEELGVVLQRNPEYLRQHYVQPLVQRGLVTMSRPEEPNDPQQAYRAVEATRGG